MPKQLEFKLIVLPRVTFPTKAGFIRRFPINAIGLDGVILDKPFFDKKRGVLNFDHHNKVIREATMSTSMQMEFGLAGGLIGFFSGKGIVYIVVNDPDQDTTYAVSLLLNHDQVLTSEMRARRNLLLELTNKWDVTAGAFPLDLPVQLIRQHAWVFRLYTEARSSGDLYRFDAAAMEANLRGTLSRIDDFIKGKAQEVDLCDAFTMVYKTDHYWMFVEQGPETRYRLWNEGMKAFVALLGTLPNGRKVYTAGCRSRFMDFPPLRLVIKDFNALELAKGGEACWGGSDTVAGSRNLGSVLDFSELKELIDFRLKKMGIIAG